MAIMEKRRNYWANTMSDLAKSQDREFSKIMLQRDLAMSECRDLREKLATEERHHAAAYGNVVAAEKKISVLEDKISELDEELARTHDRVPTRKITRKRDGDHDSIPNSQSSSGEWRVPVPV
jgi:chromosome segregation ATPase